MAGYDGSLRFNTELDNEGFDRGSRKLSSAIDGLGRLVTNLGAALRQGFSGFAPTLREAGNAAVETGDAISAAVDSARNSVQGMTGDQMSFEKAIDQTEQKLQRLYEQRDKLSALGADQPTAQWENVQRQIDATSEKLDKYVAQLDEAKADLAHMQAPKQRAAAHAEGSEGWQRYTAELERLKRQVTDDQAEVDKLFIALNNLLIKQGELKDKGADQGSSAWRSNAYDIAFAEEKLRALRDAQEAAGHSSERAASMTGHFRDAVNGLGTALKGAVSSLWGLVKRMGQMGFNAFSSGIKKAVSGLRSLATQSKKTSLTTNGLVKSLTSLKRLLITRIKRTFISAIFNNVREGIQQLARFDGTFNRTMSRIKNNATRLGGNIAVTIGNIITTLEPVITKVIDLFNTAVSAVNQFFAVITGKNTYTAAKMGTEDYAKSVDKAAKSQKKLNAELYGYDELTRQQAKNDSGNDNASGVQYETRNIDLPAGVTAWIEKLKTMWQKGNWQGVGQTIADGLNTAMQTVDTWINTKFRPLAVKWASRIGQVINGAVDRFDWPLLGKTVADGINAVFATVNTFLKTVDWLALGKGIGAAIKSWFDNIDWAMIAETFALKWNALFNVIKGIVTTPGFWESIGTAIGTFIKSWFTSIDLNAIVDAVVGILNGIPKAINAFLAQNPFEGVADKISNAINRVLHEVRWGELASALGSLFKQMLGVFVEVVSGMDWKQIGTDIGSFLAGIPWAEVLSTVGNAIWTAFKAIVEQLFSTKDGRVLLAFAAGIVGLKTGILAAVVKLGAGLVPAVLGAVTSLIGQVVGGIGTLLTTTIPSVIIGAAPAITGAVTALGAALTSPVVLTVAGVGAAATGTVVALAPSICDAIAGVDDAIHNELDTALSCYKRLFVEKGPEIANQWAQTCYQINTEGLSMEEAGIALAHRIEELSGQTMTNIDQRVTDGLSKVNVDTSSMLQIYSDLVDQHGLAVANSWFEMVSGIKLFNDNLCTNQDETNQIIVANMEAVSDWAKQNVNGTMTEVNAFVTEGLQTAEASVQSTNEAVMQGLFELNAGTKDALNIYLELVEQHGIDVANEWFEMVSGIKLFNDDLCTNQDETNQIIVANLDAISEYSQMKTEDTMSTLENRFDTGMEGINTTTDKGMDTLHGTADRGMTRVKSTLTSKMTQAGDEIKRQNWGSIGDSIVKGIGQGIQNGWTWLQNTVVNIARNLLNAAKAALGINSPSKVFSDIIGAGVTEGWALGMNQTKGDVLETVANISDAMVNEAADGATIHTQLDASMDGTISGMQAVIAGLSNVALTFKTIADTLAGIGALTTPQISAGAVVPYKTRVAATSPSEVDSGGSTGLMSNMLYELQNHSRLLELLQAALSAGNDIQIMIDGRQVFSAVVNENNRAIRRTGASPLRT